MIIWCTHSPPPRTICDKTLKVGGDDAAPLGVLFEGIFLTLIGSALVTLSAYNVLIHVCIIIIMTIITLVYSHL